MKARVEARDLRHFGQSLEDCFDGRQIVWLMQRSKRDQLIKLCENLPVNERRACEQRPSMNDTVAYAPHTRPSVAGTQPPGESINCAVSIAHRSGIQLLIVKDMPATDFDQKARHYSY